MIIPILPTWNLMVFYVWYIWAYILWAVSVRFLIGVWLKAGNVSGNSSKILNKSTVIPVRLLEDPTLACVSENCADFYNL